MRAAIDELSRAGARIVKVSLPNTKYAIATYYLVTGGGVVEPGALRRRPSRISRAGRALAGGDVHEHAARDSAPSRSARIMLGTYVLRAGYYEAYYGKALRARRKSPTISRRVREPATRSSRRPRPCRRSSSASAWAIRCRCTRRRADRRRPIWPASPRCRSPAVSPRRGCPSACRPSGRRWARRSARVAGAYEAHRLARAVATGGGVVSGVTTTRW